MVIKLADVIALRVGEPDGSQECSFRSSSGSSAREKWRPWGAVRGISHADVVEFLALPYYKAGTLHAELYRTALADARRGESDGAGFARERLALGFRRGEAACYRPRPAAQAASATRARL